MVLLVAEAAGKPTGSPPHAKYDIIPRERARGVAAGIAHVVAACFGFATSPSAYSACRR